MNNTRRLEFTKMHGIGNDYIYINALETVPLNLPALARKISDRHFGVGSDGLVLIRASETADFMMDMYNRDGSRGLMCGNAIRCVAKYVYDRGLTDKKTLVIETLSGLKTLNLRVQSGKVSEVTVNMGRPVLEPARIPVRWQDARMVDEPIAIAGRLYPLTCVSMGNPHAVTFMDQIDLLDLERLGPSFEHHSLFPDRVNTEFVQVVDRRNLRMRVWERGAGETLACGTGACAALTAAVLTERADRQAVVHLRGGDLTIEWHKKTEELYMTGPAATVFDGWLDLAEEDDAC
jgi:diaminopimelate epimerase